MESLYLAMAGGGASCWDTLPQSWCQSSSCWNDWLTMLTLSLENLASQPQSLWVLSSLVTDLPDDVTIRFPLWRRVFTSQSGSVGNEDFDWFVVGGCFYVVTVDTANCIAQEPRAGESHCRNGLSGKTNH